MTLFIAVYAVLLTVIFSVILFFASSESEDSRGDENDAFPDNSGGSYN